MDKNAAIDGIVDQKVAVFQAESNLRHAVAVARLAGASWAEIGSTLGTTRQAAQQKYADAKPNTYRCNCGWSRIIPIDKEGIRRETQVVLDHIHTEHQEITGNRQEK